LDGEVAEELRGLAEGGVQSLLLEGGPTLAASFFADDFVDKVLLFVAPTVGGGGGVRLPAFADPVRLSRLRAERSGEDVLLTAYVHEP
jgi:diaminohydroxyphosphoribosylaminopyrimidine deaminase/5-amino-6-(5-phosphoribosylamino)uracil reductase